MLGGKGCHLIGIISNAIPLLFQEIGLYYQYNHFVFRLRLNDFKARWELGDAPDSHFFLGHITVASY